LWEYLQIKVPLCSGGGWPALPLFAQIGLWLSGIARMVKGLLDSFNIC